LEKQEKIAILINEGRVKEAEALLEEYKVNNNIYNDSIAILEASIYMNRGEKAKAFDCISRGIAYNHKSYELYLMLGNYYLENNKNQAFLCYENAEFFCENEDKYYLTEVKNNLLDSGEVDVVPVSIIILSYNGKEMTSLCIDSKGAASLAEDGINLAQMEGLKAHSLAMALRRNLS